MQINASAHLVPRLSIPSYTSLQADTWAGNRVVDQGYTNGIYVNLKNVMDARRHRLDHEISNEK